MSTFHCLPQMRNIERHRNVIKGVRAEACEKGILRGITSDNNDLHGGIESLNAVHELNAGHTGHARVRENNICCLLFFCLARIE